MGAATKHLGIVSTVSIASLHPFLAVRSLTSLDYLSQGRVGWNIVTGNARSEHRAIGLDVMEHDQRYDRAEEYMAICYALWRGIPEDAILGGQDIGNLCRPGEN